MDLRLIIKNTLNSVLKNLGIYVHWEFRRNKVGNEYVIFRIISTPYTEFANNKPILQEQNVDVNYYALDDSFNYSHIELIKQTMLNQGWSLLNGETDIPFIEENIDGINMEFTREVIVNNG